MKALGNLYSVSFTALAVSAPIDLFSVLVPANRCYQLHEIRVGQTSDSGDAEAEHYSYKISRHNSGVTLGSGGSTATPVAWSGRQRDATALTDWTVGDTTQLSSTSELVVYRVPENNQASFIFMPTNGGVIEAIAAETLVVSVETTPADAVTFEGTLVFRDLSMLYS